MKGAQRAAENLKALTTTVDPNNTNLSEAEKEILRWHQRLGHLAMEKIQFLLRTGVLAMSAAKRVLHTKAAKISKPPKCAACQFGKQTIRGPKSKPNNPHVVVDKPSPVLKEDKLFPGQAVSVDHYVSSTSIALRSSR